MSERLEALDEATGLGLGVTVGEVVAIRGRCRSRRSLSMCQAANRIECATATVALLGPRRPAIWRY